MCSCEQYSCQQVEASEFPGAHGASVPVPHRTSWLTLRPPVCLPQCCWALWTPSDGPWYSLSRGILITSRRRAGRLAGLRCTPALRLVPVPWVLVRHPVKSRSEEPLCLLTRDTRSHGHKVGLPAAVASTWWSQRDRTFPPAVSSVSGFILRDLHKPGEEETARGQCASRLRPRYRPWSTLAWITFFSPHLPQADTVFEARPTVLRQMWIPVRHMPPVPKLTMFLSRTTDGCM